MNRPLALFDIDKTLYDGFSLFPLMQEQVAQGQISADVLEKSQAVLELHKNDILKYEHFAKQLLDLFARGLKGQRTAEVGSLTDNFFAKSEDFYEYADPTITLLGVDHEVVLVTAEPQFVASAVAKRFGVRNFCNTVFATQDGVFSGEVSTYLAARQEKTRAINHLTAAHPWAGSLAFGDSEGDIEILDSVETAICVNPSTGLRHIANERGWAILNPHEQQAFDPDSVGQKRQNLPR